MPILETPRLQLRHWRAADVEAWVAMGADERVMEFFPALEDRERAEAGARRVSEHLETNGYGWWVIEVRGGPSFAGIIALHDLPETLPFRPTREIGWRLPVDAWGKGYATEGARAAVAYAFDELGWDQVVSMTAAINVRSRRVMERLGMTHDSADDFEHPQIEAGHRLRPHVLYRLRATAKTAS